MKSGLRDRNNLILYADHVGLTLVSMKSGLRDRNNSEQLEGSTIPFLQSQ